MTLPASVPILTYHHTQEPPPKGAPMRSLWVSPTAFASQMRWLHRLGFQGLDMTALMPYVRGEKAARSWASHWTMATKVICIMRYPF